MNKQMENIENGELTLKDILDAQLKQLNLLKRIEIEQGLLRKDIDEIKEYQNLIILRPKDVAELFKVNTKTIGNWLKKHPHLSLELDGKKYVTVANVKLLFELYKEKYEWVEKDLPAYLRKLNSPTTKLLKEFIFKK